MIRMTLQFILLFTIPAFTCAQSIVNSKHNLSVSGSGEIKADNESQICIFCHTPHNSSPRSPLWNRQDPGSNYTLYNSSTAQALPGQPDGASILCLSCHDGTIALGSVLSRTEMISFNDGVSVMPDGRSNLSTNLSDDHPNSFQYDASLAYANGELADPATLSGPVKLENERLQCTACHDAHRDLYGHFLVASTQYSELCQYCHQKTGWEQTSHNSSTASWNGSGNNPWFHTPYTTVDENACENCHNPHQAGGPQRLTNYLPEENNCLDCHNGNVAEEDVQADIEKAYSHNVFGYTGVHDPLESNIAQNRHVECVDCHNPHQANSTDAEAPLISGKLRGINGVDTDGNPIQNIDNQFELCYRCHADSPDKPGSRTTRQIEQSNVRFEFDISGPSFHPVEAPGTNPSVPSLLPPYSETSIIYCTDCHASNNSSAAGPHGSVYPGLLKYQYETADFVLESYQAYELCYQCHNRDAIINDTSTEFGEDVHRKHIIDTNTPCNACHDPHGISSSQGDATNHSHLINFDLSIVRQSSGAFGRLEFIDDGNLAGRCYLFCHNRNHNPRSYN